MTGSTRRLLAVHAHPDDESSKGGATYAYYAASGAAVTVVSCTGGERGEVQNEALERRAMARRDMAGLRRLEMGAAQQAMGIEHRWLGYVDSGLPEHYTRERTDLLPLNCFALVPLEISAEPLVRIIRRTRPQVMITYDENGGYPHPDHIRTHELSMYAAAAAADPERYAEQGEPWRISKVYYDRIFNSRKIGAVYDALVAAGHERAEDLADMREWMRERPQHATTQVPVGDHLDRRDAALRSHASQVAPDDRFFFWPNDVQRAAWPFDDFQLVESSVETALPENDLFAGIDLSRANEEN